MEFGWFDGGNGGEYNGGSFLEILVMFVMQDVFFFGSILFDKAWLSYQPVL